MSSSTAGLSTSQVDLRHSVNGFVNQVACSIKEKFAAFEGYQMDRGVFHGREAEAYRHTFEGQDWI